MGWTLTGLGVALVIVIAAGATLALCRRYCIGWQFGTRNVWSVCEEWRQRLSWLWAPREEKVGLVKAQHPTAQTIPGLYRQAGNASQHLLHSDSDLRLDAQGAFTRFEAVDRDLHPPLGGSTIPPQPLRPAPQPRPTARPRPSPLQTASTIDYLRMQETGPGPLTPPPSLQRGPIRSRAPGPSVFIFQNEPPPKSHPFQPSIERSAFIFDDNPARTIAETIQMTSYGQNHVESRSVRQLEPTKDSARLRYGVNPAVDNRHDNLDGEDISRSYGGYDIVPRSNHVTRSYARNEPRGLGFGATNLPSATSQSILESLYGPQTVSKMLQNSEELNGDLGRKNNNVQNIEMTPFKSHREDIDPYALFHGGLSKAQDLQRVSQYIQSLPDLPVYEPAVEPPPRPARESILFTSAIQGSIGQTKVASEASASSSMPPPPPAPPDPPQEAAKQSGPTTGERIFSALSALTSQSYIDASEFYNSVLASAQQVQKFTFSTTLPSFANDSAENHLQDAEYLQDMRDIYAETDPDIAGLNGSRRSSDLYSPELNLEAHRTAQEVYNSLQDPPSSPLLIKEHSHESCTYFSDPSFTRTSEDIFNSLEQRRKSMERLNDIHEYMELDAANSSRRRNSQELYAALEEVQLKRRLSQSLEESYLGYAISDHNGIRSGSRRSSLGLDLELDESTLKRAISCESVCSDTSVNLNDLEEAPAVGHICVGLEHERWGGRGSDCEGDLTVSVLEARDLVTADSCPAQDTFVRVCLLPDRQIHVQTRIYRGCPSPSYQEKFLFPLDGGPAGRTLLVEVFSDESNIGGGASLIGEARLKLGSAARPPATTWLPLSGLALPIPHLGELMFSLSYLPTAERLTLVVVKARNLRGANSTPGDFFVKVYLLQQGKKIHKKKTSVKKGEKSPIFNEAIIFSVPAQALQSIQLRLTVAELNGDQGTNMKTYSVGHIIVGSTSTGRTLSHWRQMLAALRRPIAMWHPLRK